MHDDRVLAAKGWVTSGCDKGTYEDMCIKFETTERGNVAQVIRTDDGHVIRLWVRCDNDVLNITTSRMVCDVYRSLRKAGYSADVANDMLVHYLEHVKKACDADCVVNYIIDDTELQP
jgi:hypothetical protein